MLREHSVACDKDNPDLTMKTCRDSWEPYNPTVKLNCEWEYDIWMACLADEITQSCKVYENWQTNGN